MRTIYATTRPGWFDTKAIAKGKMLQQIKDPSSAAAGLLASPDNTNPTSTDTKLRTLQKILVKLQG